MLRTQLPCSEGVDRELSTDGRQHSLFTKMCYLSTAQCEGMGYITGYIVT